MTHAKGRLWRRNNGVESPLFCVWNLREILFGLKQVSARKSKVLMNQRCRIPAETYTYPASGRTNIHFSCVRFRMNI